MIPISGFLQMPMSVLCANCNNVCDRDNEFIYASRRFTSQKWLLYRTLLVMFKKQAKNLVIFQMKKSIRKKTYSATRNT